MSNASILSESSNADFFEAIILGAGISGLVSASVLLNQGYRRVLVLDEYPHLGGNHIACSIGDYTFDVGSFIFQDDSPLLEHLPELLPLYVPISPTWGRLNPQGVVTQYPVSIKDDIIAAGPLEWLRMLFSVLYARLFLGSPQNAWDFAQYWIGARLTRRSGLAYYIERFYGRPGEEIDIRFAEQRMRWIKEKVSLRDAFRRLRSPRPVENRQLARPKEGFDYLYQAAVGRLERSGVTFRLGVKMDSLQKTDGLFNLTTAHQCAVANRVISTIPLERVQSLCGVPSEYSLPTVTLMSLFFSFSGARGFKQSILYNFSETGSWKRLTMHSDFYGLSGGREYFAVEVNAHHVSNSVEMAERDFKRHCLEHRLFVGDLRLEGNHVLSNAYPIYASKADERAASMIASLRGLGIETFGRQGGFDYQPTARVSARNAEAALHRG